MRNGTLTRGEGDTAHKNALQRDVNLIVARPLGYGLGSTDRFRFQQASSGAAQIGVIVGIGLAGLFLGVLERVVELVLWGGPALALTWPIAGSRASPRAASRSEEALTS